MTVSRQVCLWFLLCAIAAPATGGQLGAVATIRGRVLDPQTRGVVARVRVIQVSTGLARETQFAWSRTPILHAFKDRGMARGGTVSHP